MRYTTCVSLAHRTPDSMASALERALSVSEYAELRLDYLEPGDVVPFVESVSRRMDRVVCTLRSRAEGGRFAGTEGRRRDMLETISGYGPHLTDVEHAALLSEPGLGRRIKSDMLVSWHDFGGSPPPSELRARLRGMASHSDTVKMVVTVRRPEEAAGILGLYADRGDTTLVAFAMGAAGRFTRVCSLHLGCPFMYASLDGAVAPGQYSMDEVRRMDGVV